MLCNKPKAFPMHFQNQRDLQPGVLRIKEFASKWNTHKFVKWEYFYLLDGLTGICYLTIFSY